LDVRRSDGEVETFLKEVANLKFCQSNSHIGKVVRGIVVNDDLLVVNPEEQLSVLRLLKVIK